MRQIDTAKKGDWHPADIVAALRKSGWSLRRLSAAHEYHPTTLKHALAKPYPKAERIIAAAIGHAPGDIWPSRYPSTCKHSTPARETRRNPQASEAV